MSSSNTIRFASIAAIVLDVAVLVTPAAAPAQNVALQNCSEPLQDPNTHIDIDGNPRFPHATRDGCWIFVGVNGNGQNGGPHIAVFRRSGGRVEKTRVAFSGSTGQSGLWALNNLSVLSKEAR